MDDQTARDESVAAVYIGGDSEAQVLNRAAQWAASNDGAVEIQAVHWQRLSPRLTADQPVFEIHIYFEPQQAD
ncbi:hypothetical protein GCM10010168_14230 [Actinoplanes ianthinogenes]|uniref:GyrI-like small molecule binding domain-containing protein n=1 Tax=Actinoplanes ianthinogenes TaxID=122358 RepID=A0ABN6CGA8_9ACTN|nr:hypothetical protein [Actinoplanes ianthinogenes]BCJ44610.1 hypothetical protein Aiant_52670 [Actinoplanes ianthinogenes]GGQ99039.1 hypothetical protein GCM10010168_14230 [Actinoplanes ianthinogenes]